jgi:ankyrin repeat protein
LIEHGKADINLKTITGATPLHGAALQGNTGKVVMILQKFSFSFSLLSCEKSLFVYSTK